MSKCIKGIAVIMKIGPSLNLYINMTSTAIIELLAQMNLLFIKLFDVFYYMKRSLLNILYKEPYSRLALTNLTLIIC